MTQATESISDFVESRIEACSELLVAYDRDKSSRELGIRCGFAVKNLANTIAAYGLRPDLPPRLSVALRGM